MNDIVEIRGEVQSSISDFNEPFTGYLVNLEGTANIINRYVL